MATALRVGFRSVLASALSNIHPGAGRSPGVVDLPVVKDPFGVFYVPGSGLKGALKSSLALRLGCVSGDGERVVCGMRREAGETECVKVECYRLCCLLGGDIEEAPEAPSAVSVGDLYPLLVPVPSITHGFLYVTSPMLVARAQQLAELGGSGGALAGLVEWLRQGVEGAAEGGYVLLGGSEGGEVEASLGIGSVKARAVNAALPGEVSRRLEGIASIYSLHPLQGNTLVMPDKVLPLLLERSLVRLTRVRLKPETKTVRQGLLWTEEYIPQFTLFAGYLADTGLRGRPCREVGIGGGTDAVSELTDLIGGGVFSVVVGGKETVGKGLLRLVVETQAGGGVQGA